MLAFYDAVLYVSTFFVAMIWLMVAMLWLVDPSTARSGENPRDSALILFACSTAWLGLAERRRRRLDSVLSAGRCFECICEAHNAADGDVDDCSHPVCNFTAQ